MGWTNEIGIVDIGANDGKKPENYNWSKGNRLELIERFCSGELSEKVKDMVSNMITFRVSKRGQCDIDHRIRIGGMLTEMGMGLSL